MVHVEVARLEAVVMLWNARAVMVIRKGICGFEIPSEFVLTNQVCGIVICASDPKTPLICAYDPKTQNRT